MDSFEKEFSSFEWLEEDDSIEELGLIGIGPYVSGRHPDRDNPDYVKLPIGEFAKTLGISRNSAKRHFRRGVFPREWVESSPGRKWFVYLEQDWNRNTATGEGYGRLDIAKRSFSRWKIIRRRPDASKALPDPLSIEDLALNLFSLRLFDEGPNAQNISRLTKRMLSPNGSRIYNELLNDLKPLAMKPQSQAVFQLVEKLIAFKTRFPNRDSPDPNELAELLQCSVATLYRSPFGRERINLAKVLIKRATRVGNASVLNRLHEQYPDRLTAKRVRAHLLVSLSRAEELLEEWKAIYASPEDASFEESDSPAAEAISSMASGYSIHQTNKPRNLTTGERERKRLKDRTRRNAETMYNLDWELDKVAGGTLYLSALPSRAIATAARYESMRDRKTPQDKSYRRALAKIDEKREHLGCVLPEEGGFCRRVFYDDGITADRSFPTLIGAVADLQHRLRARPTPEKLHTPDWEALEAKAVELWSEYTQHRDPSVANKTEVDT